MEHPSQLNNSNQRGLKTPIGRLPTEILQEIFLCCRSDDDLVTLCPNDALATICHVTKTWRQAAMKLPRLWCRLSIGHNPRWNFTNLDRLLTISQDRLQRAKSVPLFIKYSSPDFEVDYHPSDIEKLDKFFFDRVVVRFSSRVLNLDLDSRTLGGLLGSMPSVPRTRFDRLQTLLLRFSNDWPIPDWAIPTIDVFESATLLRKVMIETIYDTPLLFLSLALPFEQLTHLVVSNHLDAKVWRALFHRCINLRCGAFAVRDFDGIFLEKRPEVLALVHLVDLTLIFVDGSPDMTAFLDYHFPTITHLRTGYIDSERDHPQIYGSLSSLAVKEWHKQLFPLRHFRMEHCRFDCVSDLISILRAMPHLIELHLAIPVDYHELFVLMAQKPLSIVPCLECLVLEVLETDKVGFPVIPFSEYVVKKSQTSFRLKTIIIDAPQDMVGEVCKRLQTCVDEGLVIETDSALLYSQRWLNESSVYWEEGMAQMVM